MNAKAQHRSSHVVVKSNSIVASQASGGGDQDAEERKANIPALSGSINFAFEEAICAPVKQFKAKRSLQLSKEP